MIEYIYNPIIKDYEQKNTSIFKAEWLLKEKNNPYWPTVGLDYDFLFSEKLKNDIAIKSYINGYLLGFKVDIESTDITYDFILGNIFVRQNLN